MQPNVCLMSTPLFTGFTIQELDELLELLEAEEIVYKNGGTIITEGESNPYIYILLDGEAVAVRYSASGREEIFTRLTSGSVFGDVLAVSLHEKSPVTITATTGTAVLRFCFDTLVDAKAESSSLRTRLLKNLISELAQKFFELQSRINCLVRASLREKILVFLEGESRRNVGGTAIHTDMNRERLAAYLNADRSALSRELAKMKKEGLIDFYRNSFILKKERNSI